MIPHLSERSLVLAPQGRDAAVATAMLGEAGLRCEVVADMGGLVAQLSLGAGLAMVTEEALAGSDLHPLAEWLRAQPEWSDFPFVLLTQRGGGLERNPAARRYLDVLGNVAFLERPFHPTTLVSLAQSALRGRRRQYEARARLDELNALAADLERRVDERTAQHETAVAQLHEAQKLETLGQLTGGVAHDFNNLLTPITGALDLLQRKYSESDPRSGRLIGNALKAADRAKTLVQRLLGFARRQTLQTQAVDLAGLLGGMRDLVASSVGSTVELHVRHEPGLAAAMVDPNQLELAILNLCVNARDAMPDGGTLSILAEQVAIGPGSKPRLVPGHYVRLSVIDTGSGMDSATLARAIEPFFSTKEIGRGTGLGLSMVHGLAAQLGGSFALSSVVGEGTRADLYLRAAKEAAVCDSGRSAAPVRLTDRRLTILLVDDEEMVRVGTAEMLRELGHEVSEASEGQEALAMLDDGLRVDLIVTDYKMPRMDGARLAGMVREAYPDTAVLLITGYTGSTEVLGIPRLAKPFGQAELAAAVSGAMDDGGNVLQFRAAGRPGA